MKLKDIKEYLTIQKDLPKTDADKANWLGLKDALNFILESTDDMVPMYISCNGFFMYSLIVSEDKLNDDYVKDLLGWNFSVCGGYGYGFTVIKGKSERCLFEPMELSGTEILDSSMPVFFLRNFDGHTPSSLLEIHQRISHVLGIFWLNDRKAFCKINHLGDYEDIATMDKDENFILCTLNKTNLDFYLFLTRSVLIRVFDISRSLDWMSFSEEKNRKEEILSIPEKETFWKQTTVFDDKGKATTAHIRGFQIIRCKEPEEIMMKALSGETEREYASFLIWDFRNKRICEQSSDSKTLGNYFVPSELPFETSPAFFRAEVLAKYKQDPSKYRIEARKIICRGAWSIDYDINDEGQVHAYIIDLAMLPYKEQLYWKSFNEEPKSGLSKRAIKTDFLAEWDLAYDPLLSLKLILDKMPVLIIQGKETFLWRMPKSPETRGITSLNYVATDSKKEWEDQILILAQILIEGLCFKTIKQLADKLGCRDDKLGSGKQLVECLEKLGVSKENIEVFSKPLAEVWDLRSKIVAHTGTPHPSGDLKMHFRKLIESCDKAMRKLAEFIEKGLFNLPAR